MALKFLNNATFAGAVSTGGYLTLNSSDSVPRLIFNGSGDDFFFSNTASYFGLYNSTDSRWDIKVDGAGDTTFAGDVSLADNKKLTFGAAPDFEIYHNSTTNVNHISSLLSRQLSISADTTTFSGDVTANANYTAGNSKIIYKAQRSGGAVAGDWSYDDATTDMSLGTSTAHSFSLKTGNTRALTINSSQNATFAGDVSLGDAKFIKWGNGNQQILGNNTSGLSLYSNGERMRILTNGNVGIGTTSPSEKLEVDGIIKVVHTDNSYAKYRGQGVFFNRSNSYLSPEQDNFASLLIGYNGARWGNVEINGAFIKFENGPNEFMRITSAGNVGIGTDSPASKLHVAGEIRVDPGDAFVFDVSNNIYAVAAQNQFRLYSGGNPVINVPTSGNVGIGTTSPGKKLDVVGNADVGVAKFSHTTNGAYGSILLGTVNLFTGDNGNYSWKNGSNTRMELSGAGALKLNTYTAGTLVSDASGNITVSSGGGAGGPYLPLAGGTMTGNTKHNDNVFSYWGNNDDLAIRHNATDTYIENYTGDLQIVNYADDKDIIFKSDDGSGGTATYFRVDGGAVETRFLKSTRHFDDVGAYFGDSADLQIYHTGNDSYIKDAGTGDLRIVASLTKIYDADMSHLQASFTDGGSVDLYYSGNKKFETTNTGIKTGNIDLPSNGAILFDNTNNTEQYYIRNGGGSQSSFQIGKGNPGSDIKLIIDDGGNVGIGTTAPGEKLVIAGGVLAYGDTSSIGSGTSYYLGNNPNSRDIVFTRVANAELGIGRYNGGWYETMRFDADGNVGIGTTSPSSRLTVKAAGSQTTQRAITIFHDNTLAEGYASIGAQYTATNGYIDSEIRFGSETLNGACSFMSFATGCNNTITQGSNSERMRITSTGNVGIGTTLPGTLHNASYGTTRLHVDGGTDRGQMIIEGNDFAAVILSDNTATANERVFSTQVLDGKYQIKPLNDNGTSTVGGEAITVLHGGNVGIGTTNPTHKLTVNAPNDTTAVGIDFPSAHFDFSANSTSGYTTSFHMDDTATTIGSDSAGRALKFQTNNTDRLYIKGNTGNVGIGTTNPVTLLDIRGAGTTSNPATSGTTPSTGTRFRIASSTGASAVIDFGISSSGRSWLQSTDRTDLGAEYPFLLNPNGGNVGIGTTSPEVKLTIKGDALNTNQPVRITNSVTDTHTGLFLNNTGGTVGEKYGMQFGGYNQYSIGGIFGVLDSVSGNTSGDITFDFGNGTSAGSLVEKMRITHEGNVGINCTPSYKLQWSDGTRTGLLDTNIGAVVIGSVSNDALALYTNLTEKMRIDSSGNVGIGTTSPGAKLQIGSATNAPNANLGNNLLQIKSPSGFAYLTIGNGDVANSTSYIGGASGFTVIGSVTDAGALSEHARVTNTGNVGIGTTSPTARLDILTNSATGNNDIDRYVRFRADNGEQRFAFSVGRSGNNSTLQMYDSSEVQKVNIASAGNSYFNGGNVGIGETSPDFRLDVSKGYTSGNGKVAKFRSGNDATFVNFDTVQVVQQDVPCLAIIETSTGTQADEQKLTFAVGDNKAIIGSTSTVTNGMSFYTNRAVTTTGFTPQGNLALHLANTGNVGIGTTSPTEKLHVEGNIEFINGGWIGSLDGSYWQRIRFEDATPTTTNAFNFETRNGSGAFVNHMTILNNGNVGIGTTSPQSKLQVAGGIQMANDTATASAAKVGTMRYRTGTEYVEVTGTEILPNPGFDTDTNWVKGTGWTIANGKASVDNASSTALSQPSFGVTTGKIYNVRIDVSNYTSGSLQVQFGASQVIASIGANGEYNYTVTSTITGGTFYLYGVGDCEFSVDNASVIEVTAEDASYADMCMQTGSSTYEWVNIVRNTY